jgi:hypothetical protein
MNGFGMMSSDTGGMGLIWLLVLAALILGIAALIKCLQSRGPAGLGR